MGSMIDLVNSITHAAGGAMPVSVPITHTVPAGSPVTGIGNWLDSRIFETPEGASFQRREGSRFMSVVIATFATSPHGTVVVAPEVVDGSDKTWRVEGSEPAAALGTRVLILVETA